MKINNVHCLFEQSGTFKNEFIKLGINAYDYDILNDFNETDFIIDLFQEINNAFDNKSSIFDTISSKDLIIAFFPCIRFENNIIMHFQGTVRQMKDKCLCDKLLYDLQLHQELSELYKIITKLVIVCIKRNLRLIIENPYSTQHYLTRYWAFRCTCIDIDRRISGDYLKKPTQYWFLNCVPSNNLVLECNFITHGKGVNDLSTVARSMISKHYANRFIKELIL